LIDRFGHHFLAGANSDIYVQSAPIEQLSDAAMNILTTSLAALKEASAFAVRIPYLSPIAGLILQALAMRDVSILLFTQASFSLTDGWTEN
jgi:hypothetical protein